MQKVKLCNFLLQVTPISNWPGSEKMLLLMLLQLIAQFRQQHLSNKKRFPQRQTNPKNKH
jgi:hypothetical protein